MQTMLPAMVSSAIDVFTTGRTHPHPRRHHHLRHQPLTHHTATHGSAHPFLKVIRGDGGFQRMLSFALTCSPMSLAATHVKPPQLPLHLLPSYRHHCRHHHPRSPRMVRTVKRCLLIRQRRQRWQARRLHRRDLLPESKTQSARSMR